ncbi:uncharacterized protein [Spinacia oleracea]|uniref:Uncharacterized protein isoform X2 n=1 Tax=Spinacia oleracea TaxID=3562 RepID=A0A9R0JGV3_SPIOL|nr:uncharacterized protein LOC110774788 isoform X2 [Spinacia oleracea]
MVASSICDSYSDLMDIDQVLVVPDTPDRVSKSPKNICKISEPAESSSRNTMLASRGITDRRRRLGDNIRAAGMYSHSGGNLGDIARSQGASGTAIPTSSFRNAPMSSTIEGKTVKHMDRHHCNHQHLVDDKFSRSSLPGISSHHPNRRLNPVLIENGEIPKHSSKTSRDDLRSRPMNKGYLPPNNAGSLHTAGVSSQQYKGSSLPGISSHHPNRRQDSALVEHGEVPKSSSKSTRENLGARKMNTGYVLPDNIASLHTAGCSSKSISSENKGKVKVGHDNPVHCDVHSVEGNDNICLIASDHDTVEGLSMAPHSFRPSTTVRKRWVRNGCISPHNIAKAKRLAETSGNGSQNTECAVISGGSHPIVDVNEVTSKHNAASRAKGKELYESSPKGHADRRSDVGHFADGWCNGKFPEDCVLVQDTSGNSNKKVLGKSSTSFPATSSEQKPVLNEGQIHTPTSIIKRQKKHTLSLGSPEKRSEVICLSSGGESSTRKSVRDRCRLPPSELGSSVAVGEISPEVRESVTQTDNDAETRDVQLQADEMLARELQEQLYNEISEPSSHEILSSLGWVEHQEDHVQPASSRGSHRTHAFGAAPPLTRQASQSLRNRLFRRGAQARLPRSNVPRLRSHVHRYPRGRGRLFPSDMDVDMRMDLLETMEAVVNDDIRMVNQLLESDREFGENDYEMLLALDENNHTHLGASVARIANLPESTVHNDNCEVCSICLETPAIGDTMRHLPCLHKFHKDCIDPWLRRRRSCPVCKSDI